MESDFFKLSKEVSNRFIQNVAFIDDNAYKGDVERNAFDAQVVSNEFAKSGKICAIYAPKKESDIDKYYSILDKADVIILDWRLDLETDAKDKLNPEADADVEDTRGEYTLKIINEQLKDNGNRKLKLIIIYTGDTITAIKDVLKEQFADYSFDETNFSMQFNNIKLLVRGKGEDGETQYGYNEELKKFLIHYNELPNLITSAFAEMSSGLVSNFVLEAINIIRNNTSNLFYIYYTYIGRKW